jgi:hypothetical protein
MSMLKFLIAFALAAGLAAPAAHADGTTPRTAPEKRPGPIMKRSPTDEFTPQTRRMPRARQGETRLSKMFAAPRARGVTRSGTESLTYSYLPTHPSLLAPGSGPSPTTIGTETRYYYTAPVSPDFDGAPCPTRSNTSLGELFACTLR